MTILDEITAYKRKFVEQTRRRIPLEAVRSAASETAPTRGFAAALRGTRDAEGRREPQTTLRVIAEIKKASPSKGVIREDFDPAEFARSYTRGGASAISVLTDEKYFQGSLDALRDVRAVTDLPLLRKEFMVDPYQVYEARAAGADAILLIAGLVEQTGLAELRALARELKLDVLLEIHNEGELEAGLALAPDVLGINNRDLRTREFVTTLETTEKILPRVPARLTAISESGIRNERDVAHLASLGIDGILVGEHLMRERDPGRAIAERLGIGGSSSGPRS